MAAEPPATGRPGQPQWVVARRPFRDVYIAQSCTEIADQVLLVSLAWAVLSSGSSAQLGVVLAAWALPRGMFLLFGGVLVDRHDRRALGVASSVVLAAVVGGLAAANAIGSTSLMMWTAAAALLGLVDGVRLPIGYSLVPLVVPEADVLDANRWSQLRLWATLTAGPAAGGVLVAAAGPAGALTVTAGLYLFGGLFLLRLPALPPERAAHGSVLRDLASGFRLIREHRTLRLLLPVFAAVNLFVLGITTVGIPALVKNGLDGDARGLGLVAGSFGVGLMTGTALMRLLPTWFSSTLAGLFCLFAMSDASLAMVGLAPTVPVACALYGFSGLFIGPASAIYQSVLQTTTPKDYLGRVTATSRAVSFGLEPVSAAGIGGIAHLVPIGTVVLTGGLAAAVIDTAAALRGRQLDRDTAGGWRPGRTPAGAGPAENRDG